MGSSTTFGDFSLGKGSRSPSEVLYHMCTVVYATRFFIEFESMPKEKLKKLSFEMKNEIDNLIMVLAANVDGKPQISVVVDDSLVKQHELHAGKMVKELAREIKGGGGGQPFFATAGGSDLSGLDRVAKSAHEMLEQLPLK